jgi:hypothetical protein
VWGLMRTTVAEMFPDQPEKWLPDKPMRRRRSGNLEVERYRRPHLRAARATRRSGSRARFLSTSAEGSELDMQRLDEFRREHEQAP